MRCNIEQQHDKYEAAFHQAIKDLWRLREETSKITAEVIRIRNKMLEIGVDMPEAQ